MDLRIVVALLILLQLLSVFFLWTSNSVSQASEKIFALFLAADLVAFSIVSYVYRVDKRGDEINSGMLFAGCGLVLLLVLSVLFVS